MRLALSCTATGALAGCYLKKVAETFVLLGGFAVRIKVRTFLRARKGVLTSITGTAFEALGLDDPRRIVDRPLNRALVRDELWPNLGDDGLR